MKNKLIKITCLSLLVFCFCFLSAKTVKAIGSSYIYYSTDYTWINTGINSSGSFTISETDFCTLMNRGVASNAQYYRFRSPKENPTAGEDIAWNDGGMGMGSYSCHNYYTFYFKDALSNYTADGYYFMLVGWNDPITNEETKYVAKAHRVSGVWYSQMAEYCGDTLCQTANENCSSCPSDCGECATNPNSNDSINLFFFSNPYTFSNQSTAKVRYLYNENVFTVYDYIELRKVSSDWSTSTFVATSTIIDSAGFFSDKRDGKSFFTITGDGSTVGYIHYEVIGHLAAYWSPTLGDVAATTTIPYVVSINWQTTEIPTAADILAASSSNPFYDDQAMYNAACDQEQWNTPPPEIFGVSVPALNMTVIGCKFKLGFIIAGNKFTTMATDGIYKAGNILRNVFPFNIFTNLNDAWKNSSNATVISELSFLSPVNGNLTAQIPTSGGNTATVVLWGSDIFTSSANIGAANAQKTNQLFLAIKTIIKWALWGLFGLWAIKNGKAFIEKMTGGQ